MFADSFLPGVLMAAARFKTPTKRWGILAIDAAGPVRLVFGQVGLACVFQ